MTRLLSVLLVLATGVGCAPEFTSPSRDSGVPDSTGMPDGTTGRPDAGVPDGTTRPDGTPPVAGDRDGDGIPDDREAEHGTDPGNPDTDGDGLADGVEVLAGTDPTDPGSTIPSTDFYVVLPHMGGPELREMEFTARLGKGDVFFVVDTTGSMGTAIDNVRTSLRDMIVPALDDAIADLVMGVGDYRDFPTSPFGSPGDWPFELRQSLTADTAAVQTALNGLRAGGGGDGPEALLEGLYAAAAGSCAAGGGTGAACFRPESHPIIVAITDAPTHNAPGSDPYDGTVSARSYAETITALTGSGIKVVGASVSISFGGFPIPGGGAGRNDLEDVARSTMSMRADGGLTVYEAEGGEVSASIVDGILDLVSVEVQDVTSRTIDDPSDAVDATRFIKAVRPIRATRATRFDDTTFFGVGGGTTITFEVHFENDFLPSTTNVQIFRAEIEVHDVPGMTPLDLRQVYIVVPRMDGGLI